MAWDVITEAEPLQVAAAALDESAVVGVRFLVDGQQVGPPSTVPHPGPSNRPLYYGTWLPPSGAAGQQRTLVAEAMDPSQNQGSSEPVTIELGMRSEPAVELVVEPYERSQEGLAVDGQGLVLHGAVLRDVPIPDTELVWDEGRLALGRLDLNGLTRLGAVQLTGAPASTSLLGRMALVATASVFDPVAKRMVPPMLQVVDLSNLAVPRKRGTVDLPGDEVHQVVARDRLAFVANGSAGVAVVELGNPDAPQRAFTRPTVGPARGVALTDRWLLVAAGTGGLRVLDVRDPYLRELGFIALPGEAHRVEVVGSRAYVGCSNAQAPLAVVDLSRPSEPRLLSLLSHAPRRADLLASEVTDVAVSGGVALVATAITDQDARPVKGLLSASLVKADGTASTFVRANLPGARDVAFSQGRPVALLGDSALGAFTLPRLAVTGVEPVDGADQVSLTAQVKVSFSRLLDASTVNEQTVLLRAQDAVLGPVVPASVTVEESRILLTPLAPLPTHTDLFLSVLPTVSAEGGLALGERFVSRLRTRAVEGELPQVVDVQPPGGPVDGGTRVRVWGNHFAPGARVFFSGQEATQVQVAADSRSLEALTPPSLEGPATVTVLNPNGLEGSLLGGFLYLQILDVSMVVPATGSLAGGQRVELSGSGFQRGATVRFDGVPATEVRVLSPGRISLRTPPGHFGTVDVRVDNPDGRYVVKPDAFLYSNLVVSRVLGRHIPDPRYDGPIRPAEKLPQGVPRAVVLQGGLAWLLSEGEIFSGAKSPEELLEESVQAAVTLVDVSDAENAAVRSGVSIAPPYQPRGLAVRGTVGYVSADAGELPYVDVVGEGGPSLLVVDATVLQAPRLVTAVPFEGAARAVALADDLALVAAGPGGLAIFSVADPLRPVLTGAIQRMRVKGEVRPVEVLDVATSGRYAVLRVATSAGKFTLVLDLASPGLEVVGEASDLGPMALQGWRGLALSSGQIRTLSLSPPTWPRTLAGMASLVGGTPRVVAVGPHVGAAGTELALGSSYASGKLEVSLSADPSRPRAVDAVDLFPAALFGGVAVERDVAVISISATLDAKGKPQEDPKRGLGSDGLAVVRMPFIMGVSSQPTDGETGVPPSTPLRLEFNREVAGVSAETVRLIRQDGSVNGVVEPAALQVIGRTVLLLPAQPLAPATDYRVVAEGLTDAATQAEMAGPFVVVFSTATGSGAMPVSIAGLTPREGPAAGGTLVEVTGTGFEPGAAVRFGGVPATQVTVSEDGTRLTARTPANLAGAVTLEVANPSGSVARRLGAFLFTQPLSLLAATPGRGPATGGTRVILTGTGFSSAGTVQVRFGGVPSLRTRVLGLGRLEVYTPSGLRGVVDIQVTNPDGSQALLEDGFIFDQPGGASVGLPDWPVDVVVIGDSALVLQRSGLSVVDLSGLYRKGPLKDTPIPAGSGGWPRG